MEPIKKERLSDKVISAISEMIKTDNFKPGDQFYSENELVKKLQVSRASIREAIRILEVNGKVSVRQGKGIFIVNSMEQRMEAFTSWVRNNETTIFDHFEVRLIIEPKTAWYAALKATETDKKNLEEAYECFRSVANNDSTPGLIEYDEVFHLLIAKATKNRTLAVLMKTMTKSLQEGWITSLHIPGRIENTLQEHREILDAILQGNPEMAEQAMLRHLTNALHDIRASVAASAESL